MSQILHTRFYFQELESSDPIEQPWKRNFWEIVVRKCLFFEVEKSERERVGKKLPERQGLEVRPSFGSS